MKKRIISLMLVMALLSSAAMAVDSKIIINGKGSNNDSIEYLPGIGSNGGYTETDLFVNFKGVMPGDTLTEQVTITNKWTAWDYVNISMDMILHDENDNVISTSVMSELTADERRETTPELEYMYDFLKQFELTIKNGDAELYKGPADKAAEDFLVKTLSRNQSVVLDLALHLPIETGNEYAKRVGEVDWVITYSGWDEEEPTTAPTTGPTEPTTGPVDPTEPTIDIEEPTIPLDPPDSPDSPDTGDRTETGLYIALFAIGLAGMLVVLFGKRKKEQE